MSNTCCQVRYWNIPMVTAGAMASDFGTFKKETYPLLTRVGPSFNSLSEFIISTLQWFRFVITFPIFCQSFGWRKSITLLPVGGDLNPNTFFNLFNLCKVSPNFLWLASRRHLNLDITSSSSSSSSSSVVGGASLVTCPEHHIPYIYQFQQYPI